jgi:DNA-binding Lrp family transcriptional regulator
MKSPKANRKNGNIGANDKVISDSARGLDSLDIKIIDELLANANISSTNIASKHGTPLSTIQRRRAVLESMSLLKHEYRLAPLSFGLRPIQFWVLVEGGHAEEVANHIFQKHINVLEVTIQVNALSNVGIRAYVQSSDELFSMLEEMKSMRFVTRVEFAEVIDVVGTRQTNFFKMKGAILTPASQ